MNTLVITVAIGAIAIAIVNGASLSKHDQPNPSEYDEKSCPRRCSEAYYPLCGINENSDTKVFVNDCYMAMENCNQLAHQGARPFTILCTAILNPTICHPWIRIYHTTDESDCPDFDEWINEDSLGRKRHS